MKKIIERRKHTIDATKRPLGRLATEIALLLMGKDDENYQANMDSGGFVTVKNIERIVLTGDKEEKKEYYRHTGYMGGLKVTSYKKMNEKSHGAALKKAVYGMLPKNKLRVDRIKRLTVE